MKTQLLCTFSTKTDVEQHIELIKANYTLAYNYIYILQNKNIPNELYTFTSNQYLQFPGMCSSNTVFHASCMWYKIYKSFLLCENYSKENNIK